MFRRYFSAIEPCQDFLGRFTKIDPEVIHQNKLTVFSYSGMKRKLGEGWAAPYQGAAGIVADAARYRRADAAGADDGMRLTSVRPEFAFQLIKRNAGVTNGLRGIVDQFELREAHRVDDNHGPVIALSNRCRATG